MSRWLPLESNPDVMNKYLKNLGVTEKLEISDVISLDENSLDEMQTPLAVLLLFPSSPKYVEYRDKQEEQLKKQEKVNGVYFLKQTIENACGTVALLHALANNESHLSLKSDSVLKKFLDSTRNMSPDERGKHLEQDLDMRSVHECSALEGQTEIPNLDEDANMQFMALVNINDKLIELDGRKSGPFMCGATSGKTLLKDAFRVCKEYMQRDSDNLNFTVLAFGAK